MKRRAQPEAGQVWADKQKGQEGRTIRIEAVDSAFVYARLATPTNNAFKDTTGRQTRVRIENLHKNYALVEGAES